MGERRYCALAADDPWTHRRSIRLEEVRERTVAIDRRTGSTTTDLWPSGPEPTVEYTQDIDDWLAVIAAGRCVGVTPERTVAQYRRQGVASKLVEQIEAGLADLGCPKVNVIVRDESDGGRAFWKARGYDVATAQQFGKELHAG